MRFALNVNEKGKEAMDKIAAFNPGRTKIQILSEILVEAAKAYKGRKPKADKTVKKGR